MKKKKDWGSIFIVVSILVGIFCYMQYTEDVQKEEYVQSGIPIGKEYIRKHYNAEFIYKNYDFIGGYVNSTVYLRGYIKGHEGQIISLNYDYKKKKGTLRNWTGLVHRQ